MSTDTLETIEIKPQSNIVDAVIIWMHGLGADATDFVSIVEELNLKKLNIKFVFPNAKERPVTINNNISMRAWYDIKALDLTMDEDVAGIKDSVSEIHKLIYKEIKAGTSADKILLAGFSQGGGIALHAGFTFPEKIAGVLGLSTYVPAFDYFAESINPDNVNLPVLLQHGLFDPVVPLFAAQQAKAKLEELGLTVGWETYPMAHSVCIEEIRNIAAWLKEIL